MTPKRQQSSVRGRSGLAIRPGDVDVSVDEPGAGTSSGKWKHSWSILAANRLQQGSGGTAKASALVRSSSIPTDDDDELFEIGRSSRARTRSVVMAGCVGIFKAVGAGNFVPCFAADGSQLVGASGSCGNRTCYFSNPARVDSQCTC